MTNTTEDEIKALQIKAGEIYDHFQNCSAVYVCSGQEIFELNRENHDDCFTKACVADKYWWKFEWYLKGSDLWKDSDFDNIDEGAAEFEGRFAGFFQEG